MRHENRWAFHDLRENAQHLSKEITPLEARSLLGLDCITVWLCKSWHYKLSRASSYCLVVLCSVNVTEVRLDILVSAAVMHTVAQFLLTKATPWKTVRFQSGAFFEFMQAFSRPLPPDSDVPASPHATSDEAMLLLYFTTGKQIGTCLSIPAAIEWAEEMAGLYYNVQ